MVVDYAAPGNSDELSKSFWLSFPPICMKPEKLIVGQSIKTLPRAICIKSTPVPPVHQLERDTRV